MDRNEIILDMIGEFLTKKYNLYIQYSIFYKKFITVLAQKTYNEICIGHKPIDIMESLNLYPELLDFMKENPDINCEISYEKDSCRYNAILFKNEVKGLIGEDEYVQRKELYAITEKNFANTLELIDKIIGNEKEEKQNRNGFHKKVKINRKINN